MTHVGDYRRLPGFRLRRFAEKRLDRSAVEMLVLPIIADLQHEYSSLPRSTVARLLVLLGGYWGYWKAIGLHMVTGPRRKGNLMVGFSMRRWTLLIFASIIFAGTATYGWFRPVMYRSETRLLIEPALVSDGELTASEIKDRVESQAQSIVQLLESRSMLERIVEEFRLRENRVPGMENAIKSIRKNIEIAKGPENVISIAYRAPDARAAQAITHRMAEVLIVSNLTSMRMKAMEKVRFLDNQLKRAKLELAESLGRTSPVKVQGSYHQQLLFLEQAQLQQHVDEIDRMKFKARMAADAIADVSSGGYRILDDASLAESPMFPTRAQFFGLGIAAALVVALPSVLVSRKGLRGSAQSAS